MSAEQDPNRPYSNLRLGSEREGAVAVITIDRPEVRNAIDSATVAELHRALDAVRAGGQARVLVITGGGERVFVSGADIRDLAGRSPADALAMTTSGLCQTIERFELPTIAAINGFALGGGCELAMACNIRVAAEHAKFGFPETGLGIIPGAGGTQRLPRLVGRGKAEELILTGDIISAATALAIGLVHQVVPAAGVMAAALAYADKISSRGPFAIRLAKLALLASSQTGQDSGLVIEALAQAVAFSSEDKREGTSAFLEKRPPHFRNR